MLDQIDSTLEVQIVDEYVQTDLKYLELLSKADVPTLLLLVGVQSHQFHRGLDLAAFALKRGVEHVVIGGPHVMTCDTSALQGFGLSFALAEAEIILPEIIADARDGALKPVYGGDRRWKEKLDSPVLIPPSARDLRRYIVPMVGVYPARGCVYTCNFCSVIMIAGRQIRSQNVETSIASLRAIQNAGAKMVMFTSDNFNKYAEARDLLKRMIEEKFQLSFFVQCDTQVHKDEELIELLARAGCFSMFVGVESFDRKTLLGAHKAQNYPKAYSEIVRLCRKHKIASHFSNIIGFPGQTQQDIHHHWEILDELDPDVVSFYILTAIPGTLQYQEFLDAGLITELNLDRYDGTTTTWNHDQISQRDLRALLFESYHRFYNPRRLARFAIASFKGGNILSGFLKDLCPAFFSRYSAWNGRHPMSGGVGRKVLDSASDYAQLRWERYGINLAPLPHNLKLSQADTEMNSRVKLPVAGG